MSKNAIDHVILTDDDGSGTTGTILNNSLFDQVQDAVDAAIGQVVQTKSGAYTVLVTDDVIECSGTFTLSLYTAVGNAGRPLEIVNVGTGTITADPFGSQTIGGAATRLVGAGTSLRIRSNGTNWIIAAGTGIFPLNDPILAGRTQFGGAPLF